MDDDSTHEKIGMAINAGLNCYQNSYEETTENVSRFF